MSVTPLIPTPLVLTLCGACRRVRPGCRPTARGLRCPACPDPKAGRS